MRRCGACGALDTRMTWGTRVRFWRYRLSRRVWRYRLNAIGWFLWPIAAHSRLLVARAVLAVTARWPARLPGFWPVWRFGKGQAQIVVRQSAIQRLRK